MENFIVCIIGIMALMQVVLMVITNGAEKERKHPKLMKAQSFMGKAVLALGAYLIIFCGYWC